MLTSSSESKIISVCDDEPFCVFTANFCLAGLSLSLCVRACVRACVRVCVCVLITHARFKEAPELVAGRQILKLCPIISFGDD